MKFLFRATIALTVLVCCSLWVAPPAAAADAASSSQPKRSKSKKSKAAKPKPATSSFLYGSSETQDMRDKRLSRECRGAANGGACSGYTR